MTTEIFVTIDLMNLRKINVRFFLPMILLSALLLFLLYWRWQVSQTRFLDIDEFSYLHWAADFARGQRPYTDFFMFFTPGFLWFFAPLVLMFPFSAKLFIAARVVHFGLFVGVLALLGWLFAITRSKRWLLLPVVILAFLPMPYDKYLETRPDNLSTLLALGGLIMEVFALLREKGARRLWFWSGILYTGSLLVFAKTLPFIAVGGVVAFMYSWWGRKESFGTWLKSILHKKLESDFASFLLGLVLPLGIFLLWLLTLGDIGRAWYSLTKLPFEANMIGKLGIMEPHLFFFPNGSFYGGTATVTLGLILNHALWFLGIMTGVYRFFTPFIGGNGDRRKILVEMLISGIFLLSVFGYVQFFPLKHSQYLIPIAIFIAYYASDALVTVLRKVDREIPVIGIIVLLLIGGYYIARATIEVNTVKLSWSNAAQLTQTNLLMSSIPPTAAVLDLEGRMVFWKDAYYICCVPFGSFVPFLSHQPPVLREVLEAGKVPYIFQGESNRLYLLTPDDLAYIRSQYAPVPGWGEELWKRK